jgi:formate-dependent nitrite reductase cytochrome c552 subunit
MIKIKKLMLALTAASLISLAVAQDTPSTNQQAAPPPAENGGRHHGPPDPAQHAQMLAKHLNLTSDQQTKVQEVFTTERSRMESLRGDSSLSQQDRRSKMMDIHKSSDAQVRAVLDSTQQKKWDEMQAKREQWGERHGGPGGDPQGPPPQQ